MADVGCIKACRQSCSVKNSVSSDAFSNAAQLIGLVLAILGGLSLIGHYYPASGLNAWTGILTIPGTYALVGSGVAILAITLVIKYCCNRNQKEFSDFGKLRLGLEQDDDARI